MMNLNSKSLNELCALADGGKDKNNTGVLKKEGEKGGVAVEEDVNKCQVIETSYRIKLIAGNANPLLAREVAQRLGIDLCKAEVGQFENGEIKIKVHENVRGDDCFVIQPTSANVAVLDPAKSTKEAEIDVNTALMELLLIIHTLKLSSAKRITAIIPYFAYSRQDRKTQSRVPISASAVAQLIQSLGVDRVVTLDLHCGQIQGFFRNMPVDNLFMFPEFCAYILQQPWFDAKTTAVISPDAGGVERATNVADRLRANHIVTILKRRVEAGKVDSMQTVGDVKGFNCVIIDDMVDTAGTLIKACELLKKLGASKVVACASHGILTDPACDRINKCDALDEIVVSNSITQERNVGRCQKIKVISFAGLLSESIKRLHSEESLSKMFSN